jgi:thermostable 8-oxoguanine DNA glycosylase
MAKGNIIGQKKITDYRKSDLEFISSFYMEQAKDLFIKKGHLTESNDGKWNELIYCILAGSQFPVTKLKIIHNTILNQFSKDFSLSSFKTQNNEKINKNAHILKGLGYRYHTQKSHVIASAAEYLWSNYNGSFSSFLMPSKNPWDLRKELTNSVKGIGIKIASHWLRNLGYDVCTIDIHLRRLLTTLGIFKDNINEPLRQSDFLLMEKTFITWSQLNGVSVGVLQYSVWEFVRNFYIKIDEHSNKITFTSKVQDKTDLFTV